MHVQILRHKHGRKCLCNVQNGESCLRVIEGIIGRFPLEVSRDYSLPQEIFAVRNIEALHFPG